MRIRRVSSHFRDYIDSSHFKTTLTSITISISPTEMHIELGIGKHFKDYSTPSFVIQYDYGYEDHCLMTCLKNGYYADGVQKVLKNQNYVDKFCDDLERILRLNGSVLNTLFIYFGGWPGLGVEITKRNSSMISRMFSTILRRKTEKTVIISADDIRKNVTQIWNVIGKSFKRRKLKTEFLQVVFLRGHLQIMDILDNLDPKVLKKLDIVFCDSTARAIGHGEHIEMEKYDRPLSRWLHDFYTNPNVDTSSELYNWVKEYFI
ncbi:hypothetical protein CAEBREN_15789 [Caenorhabditis brenneri]|uniref:DUF38 domain-containing protein n=1 Tax=Caenorhabditis brenneri TaxID=135651 RepID=G0P5W9_CAEBE|nr:hypothetical protein CAEBREN_15789 [Caenorhabditis brenneri]